MINLLKEKIKELKQTSKGKAILKLIGWGIFFLLIIIFILISMLITSLNDNNINNIDKGNPTPEEEKINVEDILSDLVNKDFTYTYEVNTEAEKYLFKGEKKGDTNTGFKVSSLKTINYYIDNTGIYEQTTDNKTLIEDFYANLEEQYLKEDSLKELLTSLEYIREDNLNTINLSYQNEELKITVIIENKLIKTINIEKNDTVYNLEYNF